MLVRQFSTTDTEQVVALWERCDLVRPWNDPRKDIARKLEVMPELFLVGEQQGTIVGSIMGGYEGHRGWINYLAIEPTLQGSGLGKTLVDRIEALLYERGCPKINLMVRGGNDQVVGFYESLGYTVENITALGKRLIPDD